MRIAVHGMACLGSFGPGIPALLAGTPLPLTGDGTAPAADTAPLKDRLPPRSLRQMDHVTRMALLCLLDAMDDAALPPKSVREGTGIILVTGYGSASSTFAFLDSIIAYGELAASPLAFSHSVHNIPAASLAMRLDLAGPCSTVCQTSNPVGMGLLTAHQWLHEGRVDRVLLGAVDEAPPLLASVTRRKVTERAASPACHPGLRANLPVSEGAAFFCLGQDTPHPARGWVESITCAAPTATLPWDTQPVFLSGAVPPGMAALPGARHEAARYGNTPIAQAFDLILALAERPAPPSGTALCHSIGSRGDQSTLAVRQAPAKGHTP